MFDEFADIELIHCPNCNAMISSQAKTCPDCGASVEQDNRYGSKPQAAVCPQCGAPIKSLHDRCVTCGAWLVLPSAATSRTQSTSRFLIFLILIFLIAGGLFGYYYYNNLIKNQKEVAEIENRLLQQQIASTERIRVIGRAIKKYIVNHPDIGAPKTSDLQELARILFGEEVFQSVEFTSDGWGNPLIYEYAPEPGDLGYAIISYGSDGTRDSGNVPTGKFPHYEYWRDIVWRNGRFIHAPHASRK